LSEWEEKPLKTDKIPKKVREILLNRLQFP
jgi:hypothetical protein